MEYLILILKLLVPCTRTELELIFVFILTKVPLKLFYFFNKISYNKQLSIVEKTTKNPSSIEQK